MASILQFIKHRIIGVSFLSLILLLTTIFVIIYNKDHYITAGIVGLLWILSSYNYFSLSMKAKAKARREARSAQIAGLRVGSKIISNLHRYRASKNAAAYAETGVGTDLEETAVVATVSGLVAEMVSLIDGTSADEAKQEKEVAIEQAISEASIPTESKELLREVVPERRTLPFTVSQLNQVQLKSVSDQPKESLLEQIKHVKLKTVEKASFDIINTMSNANPKAANTMKVSLFDQIKNAKLKPTGIDLTTSSFTKPANVEPAKLTTAEGQQVSDAITRFNNRAAVYGNGEDEEDEPSSSFAD
jgi:small-conductance mechanosensitive channel